MPKQIIQIRSQSVEELRRALGRHANPAKAKVLVSFFKTGRGEYAEGDRFLGVPVPLQRKVARDFIFLALEDLVILLQSPIHEERLTSLLILVGQYKESDVQGRKDIYEFYLKNSARVNNWDLVDSSAHHIVGAYLDGKSKDVLKQLARSPVLWRRRIAMVATWYDIRQGHAATALTIARMLLKDKHDLIHKAVGWMLREVGKHVSMPALEGFLRRYCKTMPRTMLRYAIEHFPETKRKAYLFKNSV